MIFIKFGSYQFTSVLIDGQFPNYRRVIPESQLYNFKVEKADLQNALKRVGLLVDKKSPRIYLDVKPGRLTITSQETEIGTAKAAARYAAAMLIYISVATKEAKP
jgi:DNA polymerase-3 subunit beta